MELITLILELVFIYSLSKFHRKFFCMGIAIHVLEKAIKEYWRNGQLDYDCCLQRSI